MTGLLVRFAAVVTIACALAGCRGESYRYKLTLAVNSPDGLKRASSVVEVKFFDVSIPARGTMHELNGEALYLDLGPGTRPLIALLTSKLRQRHGKEARWSRDGGPNNTLLTEMYGVPSSGSLLDYVSQIARMRGPRRITPSDLPDLVTFADINNPSSVIEVDPNNLQGTLGSNVTWNEITLEITDEPITKGIARELPWIPYYWCVMLDGQRLHYYGNRETVANTLNPGDFDWTDERRKFVRSKSSGNLNEDCVKSYAEWQQRHR